MITALLLLAAGPISKWEEKAPDVKYVSSAKVYDIERCLIDIPKVNAPLVYKQPDRAGEVTIIHTNQYGVAVARMTLSAIAGGTQILAWEWNVLNPALQSCAPPIAE